MDPTISRVECWVLRAPIAEPLANAFGAMSNRPAVFLRVAASDDAWGWGEVFCNFPQVGAEHRARLVESIFAPLLKGVQSSDPAAVRTLLDRRTRQMAIQCGEPGPFAQITGAIDQALWDLSARRAGVPLWRHLGGTRGDVNVYASGIGPERVADVALRKRAEGFRAFKLKVGFGADRDRANLASLRESLGDDATIMTDANQAWAPDDAVARIAELAPYRPHWIEEPILADHPLEVWRNLASDSAVPLAAGENIRGIDALRRGDRRGTSRVRATRRRQMGRHHRLPRRCIARCHTRRDVLPALARRWNRTCGFNASARGRGHAEELRGSRCESESVARRGVSNAMCRRAA